MPHPLQYQSYLAKLKKAVLADLAKGKRVSETARKHHVSEVSIRKWRKAAQESNPPTVESAR